MFSNTCAMTLAEKSDRILAQTRGLSGATPNATQLIEELRSALEAYRQENASLTAERDEARRELSFLKPIVCLGAQTAYEYAKQRGWDCFGQDTCKEAHDEETDKDPG
jgi:hypothetical protein